MFGESFLFLATSFLFVLSVPVLHWVSSGWKGKTAFLMVLINALLSSWVCFPALMGHPVDFTFPAGALFDQISIRIDALSAWFVLIIHFVFLTGAAYGIGYMKAYRHRSASSLTFHWVFFVLFHLSMIWVCTVQHGLAFVLSWELMSLSSLFLVLFDHEQPKTLKAGINYLVQMHLSVILLSVAFLWVYTTTGSFDFVMIRQALAMPDGRWIFLLFFVGFALKAGFIPLHSWLPHAHPAAPSHVSGIMSGVIVKMGIYGILRMSGFLTGDFLFWGQTLLTLSLCTGLYGILNAAIHRDVKRMLAFCTIENIGIIGMGMGIGLIGLGKQSVLMFSLGFGGALLHVLNHALFKSLLFYLSGSIYQQTHTKNMDRLGGLIRSMPHTGALFLAASLAVCGLPPLNGFLSEFLLYNGLLHGLGTGNLRESSLMVLSLGGLSLIGGLSVLTFSKVFSVVFLGHPRETLPKPPSEVSAGMLLPQYLVLLLMLGIVFFPAFFMKGVSEILRGYMPAVSGLELSGLGEPVRWLRSLSLNFFFFVLLCTFLLWLRTVKRKSSIRSFSLPVWGCAFVGSSEKTQYTGKSFSKPLAKIFHFLLPEQKKYHEIKTGELYPKTREYSSFYLDFIETRLLNPGLNLLVQCTRYFEFIQNGRVQSYVLYGILFIFIIFLLTLFQWMP